MARIFWTLADKQLIIEESFRIRSNPSFADYDLEAVRQAMREKLKPEQQRPLRAMAEVPWVTEGWKALQKARKDNPVAVGYVPTIEAGTLPRQEEVRVPALISLESLGTEALAAELLRRLVQMTDPVWLDKRIRAGVNAVLDARLPGMLPPDTPPETSVEEVKAKPKLVKIGVIGLLNGQQELFKQQYKGLVDFHFLEGGASFSKVKHTAQLMDWTYKTKWSDNMGKVSSLDKFSSTNGGLDTIRKLIFEKFGLSPITK